MGLLGPDDEDTLREVFAAMTRRVRLLFFTQTFGCETCLEARQILDELPPLSSLISIDEINLVIDGARAAAYGIDRAPSVAVLYEDPSAPGEFRDSRIRFAGAPSGYEFVSLVDAVLLAGGRESRLSSASRARLALVATPTYVQVFTTPTCPHCPRAVTLAHEMAFANPHITAVAVEATAFPDLVRKYHVNGVPKTVVNDATEILGALPEDDFLEQALAGSPAAPGAVTP